MNTYPQKEYPDLYNEILKDYHYRFPKFSPIPYPQINNERTSILRQRDRNPEQKTN